MGVAGRSRVLETVQKAVMTMSLSVSMAAVIVAATNFISPEVAHFPGSYFESDAKTTLQHRAMQKWPGSSQLVEIWLSGDLDPRAKMAILLGASASHDPVLLPIYRDAIESKNERMRMAAAYGYRDLLGDSLPDLGGGVKPESARQLAGEMGAVADTLRTRPLVEFWLQAALASEGGFMPGWRGVVIRRPSGTCLRAVEKVVTFDDFQYLATAYRLARNRSTRVSLMRLLGAITFQEFYKEPSDGQTGWGADLVDEALNSADAFVERWIDLRCTTDPNRILTESLAGMGVHGVHPLEPSSYDFWLRVLKQGTASQRMMAARRLYELGGRWSSLSMFQAESAPQIKARDDLVSWYRLLPAHIMNRNKTTPADGR